MSQSRSADRAAKTKAAAKTAARVKVPAGAGRPAKPSAAPTVRQPAGAAPAAKPSPPKAAEKPASVPVSSKSKPTAPTRPAAPPAPAAAKVAVPAKPAVAAPPPTAKPVAAVKPAARPEPAISPDKDLAARVARAGGLVKDQIVLTVPDPFWLHAYWQLSVQSVQRAEAALGQEWHGAKPILRVFDVTSTDTTSTSEAPLRDIVIHGGCSHWYIDVPQPPRSYRVDIGYQTRAGRFFPISRSNVVLPPKAGASEALDETWAAHIDDKPADHYSPSAFASENGGGRDHEDPFQRTPKDASVFGSGALLPGKLKKFSFDIDAHLIVTGRTDPTAAVTLQNEPVKLRPDGTFTMRFSLPDSRQIIPAVATAADGMEEQTIVLAIERNTKRLDPMIHDLYGDS